MTAFLGLCARGLCVLLAAALPLSGELQAQGSAAQPSLVPPPMQPCKGGFQPPVPRGSKANWITGDDYPAIALRQEMQGRVYITITVGVDGRARDVEVTSSSAGPVLDQATIAAVKRRARFMPALKQCKPVDGEFETSLNWILPE